MRNLKTTMLYLIAVLVFFYNIERVDITTQDVINIQSYVYILVTLVVLATLMFPVLAKYGRVKGLIAWLTIYAIVKVWFYSSSLPFIGTGNIYLVMIEVLFISLAWLVSLNLAETVIDIEDTYNNLFFLGDEEHIKIYQNSENLIKSEVYRSRRFNIPLSVLCLDVDKSAIAIGSNKTMEEIQQRLLKRSSIVYMANQIAQHLRKSDNLLVDIKGQRLYILSPGTDSSGIKSLEEKINVVSKNDLGIQMRIGAATFPDEANTFDDLLQVVSINKNNGAHE